MERALDSGAGVLADWAERKEEIDVAAAQRELTEATKEVDSIMSGAIDSEVALNDAMRAQAKVDAAKA